MLHGRKLGDLGGKERHFHDSMSSEREERRQGFIMSAPCASIPALNRNNSKHWDSAAIIPALQNFPLSFSSLKMQPQTKAFHKGQGALPWWKLVWKNAWASSPLGNLAHYSFVFMPSVCFDKDKGSYMYHRNLCKIHPWNKTSWNPNITRLKQP